MPHRTRASFVLCRMRYSRVLLGCVLLAALTATSLTAALANFSSRALPQAADRQIAASAGLTVQVSGSLTAAQAATAATAVAGSLRHAFGDLGVTIRAALWSDPLGLASQPGSGSVAIAEVAALQQFRAQARLMAGAWPGPPSRGQPVQVAAPAGVARQLGLAPGRVAAVRDRITGAAVHLLVTGLYRPRDPAAPYWGLDLVGTSGVTVLGAFRTYGPFLADPAVFGAGLVTVGQASWLAIPDSTRVPAGQLLPLATRISEAASRLQQDQAPGGLQVRSTIPQVLTGVARSYGVARSLLAVSVLQLLLVAGAAMALAARLLASRREEESALLAARGAARSQLAWLAAAEALLLAGAAAAAGALLGALLAGPLAQSGPLRAARLTAAGIGAGVWWAAGAVLALAAAILLWPALRPAPAGTAQARRGRQAVLAGITRAGGDLAIVLLAALAAWQLRRYSAVTRSSGAVGVDPVLVAAPALFLAGAALVPMRLVPVLARLAELATARSRRLSAAMASWEISRRPLRQSGPALLAILAVATGTLALAQQQTWRQAARDQAAYTVGADVRADLTVPVPLSREAAVSRAPGVLSALPVSRFNAGVGGEVLALDARQAAATVLLRADLSPLPAAALWRKIIPAGPRPGLALPGLPARVALLARLGAVPPSWQLGSVAASLSVQDGYGTVFSVPSGSLPPDGRSHALIAELSPRRLAAYPLRLLGVTWAYQLPPDPAASPGSPAATARAARAARLLARHRASFSLTGITVSAAPAGPLPAPFARGSALAAWHPAITSATLASDPHASGTEPVLASWQSGPAGSRQLTFGPGYGNLVEAPGASPLPVTATVTLTAGPGPATLPAIVTEAFLRASGAAPGGTLPVPVGNYPVPVRIVAMLRDFPTAAGGGVLIVDQAAIQEFLAAQLAPPLPVNQWWLRTSRARIPPGLPSGAMIADRARREAALLGAPLAAAPQQAAIAIAVAAGLLAALGFSVSVAAGISERRTRSALLTALGASRASQALQLCLEQLLLSGPAALAGLALGAGTARLLVPAVTLTPSAALPVPPALVALPLGWAAGLALAVTAIPVLAAAATILRRPDPAAQLRAADMA